MRAWLRQHRAAIALALLSPAIAELLTGSTPITGLFVNPALFGFLFLLDLWLYGTGVLLIREARVRWRKGWGTVLLLGAAYGILEEGIAVHTFFQTGGSPVGVLGSFGHFLGVDWLWAVGLTMFHSAYSIALPILLVDLIWPEQRSAPFLGGRALPATLVLYLACVGILGIHPAARPSLPLALFFLALAGTFAYLGWRIPADLLRGRDGPPTAGRWGWIGAGVGYYVLLTLAVFAGPSLLRIPILCIGACLLGGVAIVVYVRRHVGTDESPIPRYWFAVGMFLGLFAWDVPVEFVAVPGILLVTGGFVVLLLWLHRRLGIGRLSAAPPPPSLPGTRTSTP